MAGRFLRVNINTPAEEVVETASSVIQAGGSIVYPSDTVYGVIADASCRRAVEAVAAMKGYSVPRPFIVLTGSIGRALELTSRKDAKQIMEQYWPGPVTLVFPASALVHPWLLGDSGTVAIRIPSDTLSMEILKHSKLDLITTSANRRGEPFSLLINTICPEIINTVSLVIDGYLLPRRKPSRIIDFTGTTPVEIR